MLGASVGLVGIPWLLEVYYPNDLMAYALINLVAGVGVIVSIIYWLIDYWAQDFLDQNSEGNFCYYSDDILL